MVKTKPKNKKIKIESSIQSTFISVQIFAVIFYIIMFLLSSGIALAADLSHGYDYIFSLCSFVLCSFATGFFAGIKLRQNGMVSGILFSLPMNVIVVLISLFFTDFKVDYTLAVTITLLILASAIGGILAVNKRRRR